MKISDFIENRNVSYDTVRKYIVNHQKLFHGHIGKSNNIVLDDTAIQILEEKYPFPEPVQVIQDNSARDELLALHKKYAAVLEENKKLVQENANLLLSHHKQHFLEEDNSRLQEQIEKDKEKIELQTQMINVQNEKLKELFDEIKLLKEENMKPWWKRIGRR